MRVGIYGTVTISKSGDITESTSTLNNGVVVSYAGDAPDIYYKSAQSIMGLKIGIQKSFFVQNRFEPYWGVDLNLSNSRSSIESSNVGYYSDVSSSYDRVVNRSSNKSMRGINVGLNTFLGFNYYVASRFALGAEFAVTPIYLNYSGITKQESSSFNTTPNGFVNYNSSSSKTQKGTTTIGNSFNGTVQITATLFLCQRK